MITTETLQKINLTSGFYNPEEAREVVSYLFDKQINFHRVQHLSQWEKDNSQGNELLELKVNELKEKKKFLLGMIDQAAKEDQLVSLSNSLSFSIT